MSIIYSSKPLRERADYDYYPTPVELCRAALSVLPEDLNPKYVLDPGAGDGVWGKAYRELFGNTGHLIGIEIRDVDNVPEGYSSWFTYDYLESSRMPGVEASFLVYKSDLIMGNPPYYVAEEFIDESLRRLKLGGCLLFLLRLSFLESKKRYNKYFNNNLNPMKILVSTRRVSYTGNKKSDNTAYMIALWQKGWVGKTRLDWLNWEYE